MARQCGYLLEKDRFSLERGDEDEGCIKFVDSRRNTRGLCDQRAAAHKGHNRGRAAELGNYDCRRTGDLGNHSALPGRDETALLLTSGGSAETERRD